jgi:hypothetical protein
MLIQRSTRQEKPYEPPTGPKPILPMDQLPIYRVKVRDLEAYLGKVYRMFDFDFLTVVGVAQGESVEYKVQAALPCSITCARQAQAIRRGHKSGNVPLILNVLCLDGYIPVGTYIIDTRAEAGAIDVYTSMMKTHLNGAHPECMAFKESRRNDKKFLKQAAHLDKVVAEAVAAEEALLKR